MFRSPNQAGLPALSVMLADLPASQAEIARHLGLSVKTLGNYLRENCAPRPVMLALFWETRWGRSAADTEAANFGALYFRQAKIMERQNAALLRQIARLETELAQNDSGAANGPIFKIG